MKICKIYIKGFQQFQDVELDFTNPETGEPLDKVCFIGRNGTGKSTILEIINKVVEFIDSDFSEYGHPFNPFVTIGTIPFILVQIRSGESIYILYIEDGKAVKYLLINFKNYNKLYFEEIKENLINGTNLENIPEDNYIDILSNWNSDYNLKTKIDDELGVKKSINSSKIYSPSESKINGYFTLDDVPNVRIHDADSLFQRFPSFVIVSPSLIKDFWTMLIFHIKIRAKERKSLSDSLTNRRTQFKVEMMRRFDAEHPFILPELSRIWNKILSKSGLYFDADGAKLDDNLEAYIRLNKNDELIPYAKLSTGIRNYMFRLGHIFTIHFNREIDRGFLLVDEPENSLFPDFLFDLVETYQEVIKDIRGQNNTQMFFATHSPIIAAQFEPYERIILDWNDDATVNVKKGISPVGDDPNDILTNDFELENLMGPEGRKMWNEYISLKKKSIRETDKDKKDELIHQIEKIGSLYNFS